MYTQLLILNSYAEDEFLLVFKAFQMVFLKPPYHHISQAALYCYTHSRISGIIKDIQYIEQITATYDHHSAHH